MKLWNYSEIMTNEIPLNNYDTANLSYPPCTFSKEEDVKKYKCSACKELMVNVHQADDCGCKYCFTCLNYMFVTLF